MRCNLWHLNLVDFVLLFTDMLKILFPMERNHRSAIFVQKQKYTVSLNHRLNIWIFSIFQNTLKAFFHFWNNRHHSCTTFGFRVFNYIFHISCSLELMSNDDSAIFKIKVTLSQPHKFRNTKSRLEQNKDTVVVFAKMLVIL